MHLHICLQQDAMMQGQAMKSMHLAAWCAAWTMHVHAISILVRTHQEHALQQPT